MPGPEYTWGWELRYTNPDAKDEHALEDESLIPLAEEDARGIAKLLQEQEDRDYLDENGEPGELHCTARVYRILKPVREYVSNTEEIEKEKHA